MANGGSIRYDIGFNVSKGELNQITASLQQIQTMTKGDFLKINPQSLQTADKELKEMQQSAKKLEDALKRAFNSNLGTLNIAKFNNELKSLNLNKIYSDFSKAGAAGQNAFRNITSQVLTTNMQLKQTHSFINNMATTMANTVKWGVASSVMNNFTGSVQQAYGYVKNLDRSLNDIRIVTGMSADEMDRFAEKANKAAKSLGQTTTNYTDAALIYYQQGLSDEDVAARAETTLKAANVTGQSGEEVSEQLTAVWNGYKVSAQEAELYIDKLAAVAATTASDLEELSVGMSKVASAASIMGVDIDQLNAMIATTVSVTRQAPESVGTAYKTIFARLGDIEAGIDAETTLGAMTEEIKEISGISVLDTNGQLRDTGEIIEEVGSKWKDMSREQQVALSQAMAGTRQYNNLLSLFDNWDMYTEALNTSANAAGTLQEQQDTYMESTKAHLNQLKAVSEDLYDSLLDADTVNGVADGLTGVVSLLGDFVDSIGGGSGALALLGAVGLKVFNKQLAGGIATFITNMQVAKENTAKLNAEQEILKTYQNTNINDPRTQNLVAMKQQELALSKSITIEEKNKSNELIRQQNALYQQQDDLNNSVQLAQQLYRELSGTTISINNQTDRDNLAKSLLKEKEDFDSYANSTREAKNAIQELNNARAAFGKTDITNKETEEARRLEQAEQRVTAAMIERISAAQELDALNLKSLPSQQRLSKALADYEIAMQSSTDGALKSQVQINAAREVLDAYNAVVREGSIAMEQGANSSKGYSDAMGNLDSKIQQNTTSFQNFIQTIDLRAKIQQVVTFAGNLSQLAMGIQAFQRIGSVWSDDSLTAGEKAIQIMMSTSMVMTGLMAGINALKAAYAGFNNIQAISLLLSNKENLTLVGNLAIVKSKLSVQMRIAAAQKVQQALQEKGINLSVAEILLDKEGILTKELKTLGITKETLANLSLATALQKVLEKEVALIGITMPLKTALLSIAGVAAAVVAVGVAVYGIQKTLNAHNEAAQKASATAQELADNYNKVNEKLKEFNSLHSDYDSAITSLEDLVKGTEEYSKALDDANEKARTLIETYGLYDDYEIKNGLIEINEDALASVENKMQSDVNQSQNLASMGQIEANNKDTDAAIVNFVRNMKSVEGSVHGVSQTISNIIGKIQEYDNLSIEEQLDYGNALKYAQKELGITTSTIEQLGSITSGELVPAFQDLIDLANGNEESSDYELEKIFTNNIDKLYGGYIETGSKDENGEVDQVKVEELITAAAKHAVQSMSEEDKKAYNDRVENINEKVSKISDEQSFRDFIQFEGLIDNAEKAQELLDLSKKDNIEIIKKYAETLGYTTDQLKDITENKDGDIVVNEQVDERLNVDIGVALQNIARTEALNAVNESYKVDAKDQIDFINAMNSLAESFGGDKGDAIHSAIASTGDLGTADLSSLINLYSPEEIKEFRNSVLYPGADGIEVDPDKVLQFFGLGSQENIDKIFAELGTDAQEFAQNAVNASEKHDEAEYNENIDKEVSSVAETYDIEKDTLEDLMGAYEDLAGEAEGLDESLKGNDKTLLELAKEQARYNKAVEAASENMSDWKKALESDDVESKVETVTELKEAYGNLLDLDSEGFSSGFLTSTENLNLMEEALQGNLDSYNELAARANTDQIMMQMGIDPTSAPDLYNELLGYAQQIQNDIADIEVGATIDDTQALNAMANLMAQAGLTATEVSNRLLEMGVDADVITDTTESEDTQQVNDIEATISSAGNVSSPIVASDGTKLTSVMIPADEINYKLIPNKSVFKKATTATALKVTNAKKVSAGGGIKKTHGKSYTPKSSGSGGGGGGKKGGGGSGSSSKPKKMDRLESKKDRYHDVNVQLGKVEQELEKIEEQQNKAFGKDLINALNKEVDLLEKQIQLHKDKLEIARQEQSELRNSLSQQGVTFNEDGTIANYLSIMDSKEAAINAMIDKYNGMSAEQQENYQEEIDKAKEDFDKFVEDLGRYDELTNEEIYDIEQSIQEALDREIEIAIQKLNMEVELRLDLTEAQKDWNEFKRRAIDGIKDDDILGNAFADFDLYKTLFGNGTMEALTDNINTTLDQIRQINETGTSSIYGDDKNAAMENLAEQGDNLMSTVNEILDMEEAITDAYFDIIDEVAEKFEEQIESYEFVDELINHNMAMIKLLEGENAYEELAESFADQRENNKQILELLRADSEYYKQQMLNETDEKARKEWEALWKESISELNDHAEKCAEDALAEYENSVNAAFERLNDKLTTVTMLDENGNEIQKALGLDYVSEEWELINENAEQYLDTINSTYEVQKLERKILKDIDNSDSLYAQKELNKFMDEELEKLREKEKLTQYDIDRANALYDIKLKEIALEEAQQNKSQMRLRRDASGNYSYQFVADQDSISEAQQELDDARNSLYNMDKDEYKNNQQAILEIYQEYQDKMRDAANLSAEQREMITKQYEERINGLLAENGVIRTNLMDSAFADMAALYNMDVSNFKLMSEDEKSILMNEIIPTWDGGVQIMIDKMVAEGGFGPTCRQAMEELDNATKLYTDTVADFKGVAEDSFGTLSNVQNENIQLSKDLAEAQSENVSRAQEELSAVQELKAGVDELKTSYSSVYEEATRALEAMQKVREEELKRAAEEAAKQEEERKKAEAAAGGNSGGSQGGSSSSSGGSSSKSLSVGSIVTFQSGRYYYDSSGSNPSGKQKLGQQVYVTKIKNGAKYPYHISRGSKLGSGDLGWLKKDQLKFDTGGYTGDWNGNEGRTAMLHKKELVLNKDDTKNFLAAIHIVRDMESVLSALNDSMLSRVTSMTSTFGNTFGYGDNTDNTVNQNVSIQASFPNVSSRAEIEEAFENLVNMASQHAFNTQR